MNSDLAGDITHEVLIRASELLKFAPIPGLEGSARVLLGIWEALQQVEVSVSFSFPNSLVVNSCPD